MRALLLFLFALLALQGCTHYLPPLAGPTAKLRFVTLPGNKTEIHALKEARCESAEGASIALLGGADPVASNNAREIAVRSDQGFAAQIKTASGAGPGGAKWAYAKCSKRFVLQPKEGASYEAQLEQYNGGCTLNIFRIGLDAGIYVRRVADAEVTRCR